MRSSDQVIPLRLSRIIVASLILVPPSMGLRDESFDPDRQHPTGEEVGVQVWGGTQRPKVGLESAISDGTLFTAAILSTEFTNKYAGHDLLPGDEVTVRLPSGKNRTVKLFNRTGTVEVVPLFWESADERTLYVAFTMLTTNMQAIKILLKDKHPDHKSLYIQGKIEKLWTIYSFEEIMRSVSDKFKNWPIVFTGLSHGAVLAQAAAFRWKVLHPESSAQISIMSFNGYRWCDESYAYLIGSLFGTQLMPVVLGARSEMGNSFIWDSLPGFPKSLAVMPATTLVDINTGELHPCPGPNGLEACPDGPQPLSRTSVQFFYRASKYHTWPILMKALKAVYNYKLMAEP